MLGTKSERIKYKTNLRQQEKSSESSNHSVNMRVGRGQPRKAGVLPRRGNSYCQMMLTTWICLMSFQSIKFFQRFRPHLRMINIRNNVYPCDLHICILVKPYESVQGAEGAAPHSMTLDREYTFREDLLISSTYNDLVGFPAYD